MGRKHHYSKIHTLKENITLKNLDKVSTLIID